ncbi:MAG: helix-turn-helix domain-containing protein [Parashewanella sp.]
MTSKEWYLAKELAGLEGLPKSISSISRKASLENWEKRSVPGVKGLTYEYHISCLPRLVQQQLQPREKTPMKKAQAHLVSIPFFEVYASAGDGILPFEESNSEYEIDIHPQILLNQGVVPKDLFSMPVRGDSMEPALYEGDIVLVRRLNQPSSILEGVYVLRIDHEIFVKRIQFNKFESRLRVDSDNPYYDSYLIMGDDLNSVEIIGEAVCSLGRIRRHVTSKDVEKNLT